MKKIAIIVFLVFVVFTSCKKDEEEHELIKSIPVKISKVRTEKISIPIHSSGKLGSQSESKLSFKTGGIVESIFVEEGELVKSGQVLAKLDLGEIQAKVNQAKASFEKAERDFKRVEALYKDSVVTLEQLQNVITGLDVAKSNLDVANFNLTHSKIIAPSNGRILKRFVEENELVGPGTPIVIVGSSGDNWILKISVTDIDISKVKYGNTAKVSIDAFPKKQFDAIVTEIAGAANPYTGTYEIELTIKTKLDYLKSGMIAIADIYPDVTDEVKVIPISALVDADGKNGSVFVPIENYSVARKTKIVIGGIVEDNVIIESGLDNVTEVITDGVEYLSDREMIKVIK